MQILHKAKREDNGKWIEGYYQKRYEPNGEISHFIFWTKSNTVWEYAKVDPKTICVYTGREDDDGNKIWEHDFLSVNTYDYEEPANDYFGEVVYMDSWMCWCIQSDDDEYPIPLCECEGNYLTERRVDGNIFDNPELLERS